MGNKPQYLIIHHEAGSNGFTGVNNYHKMLGDFKSSLDWDIGYHYYIAKDGKITQGRADTDEGAHTVGMNLSSLGICLEGNFNYTKPSILQLTALKGLLSRKMNEYNILPDNIKGHRNFKLKDCPGTLWSEAEIKELFVPDATYIQRLMLMIQILILQIKLKTGFIGRNNPDEREDI